MPDRPGDMDERDVDARFASIVARWDGPVPAPDDPAERSDPTAPADDGPPADTDVGERDAAGSTAAGPDAGRPDAAAPGTEGRGTAGPDAAPPEGVQQDPTDPVPPTPVPPSPWVNPSPLDVVVPSSAWRTAEPTDPATEKAAAEAEAALEEEHFEPPEVTLPPQEDLHFWGAVIGLVAGPLMLLYVVFARPFHSTRWFIAAIVVSLIGFGLLILRQPKHRDPTSGDDGARI